MWFTKAIEGWMGERGGRGRTELCTPLCWKMSRSRTLSVTRWVIGGESEAELFHSNRWESDLWRLQVCPHITAGQQSRISRQTDSHTQRDIKRTTLERQRTNTADCDRPLIKRWDAFCARFIHGVSKNSRRLYLQNKICITPDFYIEHTKNSIGTQHHWPVCGGI